MSCFCARLVDLCVEITEELLTGLNLLSGFLPAGSQRISDSEFSDYDCEDGIGVISGELLVHYAPQGVRACVRTQTTWNRALNLLLVLQLVV